MKKLTLVEIQQWVDNDEFLYRWWQQSKKPIRTFVREHRDELTNIITKAINRPPSN